MRPFTGLALVCALLLLAANPATAETLAGAGPSELDGPALLHEVRLERARLRAAQARRLLDAGDATAAIAVAASAMPQANPDGWPAMDEIPFIRSVLWQAINERRELFVLRGHEGAVLSGRFFPDGQRVLTVGRNHQGIVWDTSTGDRVLTVSGIVGQLEFVDQTLDGDFIFTLLANGVVRIWDAATGDEIPLTEEDLGRVFVLSDRTVEILGIESMAALVGDDGLLIRDSYAEQFAVRRPYGAHVQTIAYAKDGRRAVVMTDAALSPISSVLQDFEDTLTLQCGVEFFSAPFTDCWTNSVTADFIADDALTASVQRYWAGGASWGWFESTVIVWGTDTGTPHSHSEIVTRDLMAAVHSPAGDTVYLGFEDGDGVFVRLPDATLGPWTNGHRSPVTAAAFASDELRIASGAQDGTVRVWRVADGLQLASFRGHEGRINDLAFSNDGRLVLSVSEDGTARLWSHWGGADVRRLSNTEGQFAYGEPSLFGAFSPDGSLVAVAHPNRPALTFAVPVSNLGAEIDLHLPVRVYPPSDERSAGHEATAIAFTPDGSLIAVGFRNCDFGVWRTEDGASAIPVTRAPGCQADYHPRHGGIYFGYLDLETYEFIMETPAASILQDAPATSGRVIIWTEGFIEVRDDDGELVSRIPSTSYRHRFKAALSDDGRRLLTATILNVQEGVGTAVLWDVDTGREIVSLIVETEGLEVRSPYDMQFAPGGSHIFTASRTGARLWPYFATDDDLYEHAMDIVDRLQPLSEAERCSLFMQTQGCADP